jgi:hypothetical protein
VEGGARRPLGGQVTPRNLGRVHYFGWVADRLTDGGDWPTCTRCA